MTKKRGEKRGQKGQRRLKTSEHFVHCCFLAVYWFGYFIRVNFFVIRFLVDLLGGALALVPLLPTPPRAVIWAQYSQSRISFSL